MNVKFFFVVLPSNTMSGDMFPRFGGVFFFMQKRLKKEPVLHKASDEEYETAPDFIESSENEKFTNHMIFESGPEVNLTTSEGEDVTPLT